jgi:transcriptional regulator with XRE-family HTH domain
MSLPQLAELLLTSFQQVQHYESGVNRIGASRLFDLSCVLDVPISIFFDGMPDSITADFGGAPGHRSQRDSFADDVFSRRETTALIRAYYRIPDPSLRQACAISSTPWVRPKLKLLAVANDKAALRAFHECFTGGTKSD